MTESSYLAKILGDLLKTRDLSICAAESCTGGLFLSMLTDVAGSSAYVWGGVVTYSNEAKQQLVNVQEQTLIAYGAVSEATAGEMAQGVRRLIGADIGLSVTGIAGPGGGTAEKPVGLVFIGLATKSGVQVRRYQWGGNRVQNKALSVEAALSFVREVVEGNGI
jgi:nicotinamide-nucleotide amidase